MFGFSTSAVSAPGSSQLCWATDVIHCSWAVLVCARAANRGASSPSSPTSAGAASQQAIGITVFGGMLFASTLVVLLTPVLYVAVQAGREIVKRQYAGIHAPAPQGEAPPFVEGAT